LAILPAGWDYFETFDAVARGCLECGYYPYHFLWFIFPLGLAPNWQVGYLIWIAISFVLLWPVARTFGGNPIIALLAGTTMWGWWLGQMDMIPLSGLAIAWVATERKRPYWVGVGLLLLSVKPQLGLLPILAFLFWNRDQLVKVLAVPVIAAVISFIQFGIDWPLRWQFGTTTHKSGMPSPQYVTHWTALLLLPFILIMKERRTKLQYLMVLTVSGVPFVGTYGYFAFLLFPVRWWEVLLNYLGIAGMVIFENRWGLSFVIFQPMAVVLRLVKENWAGLRARVKPTPSVESHPRDQDSLIPI
jgi:hypothetical protein